jgi:MFS transporter, FSR family, fosmidomycin resistance protein
MNKEAIPGTTPKRKSFFWTSLPWFLVAHFGHHLLTGVTNPLLPTIRSAFGLDYTESSFVTFSFALSAGLGQMPSGWLADRIKPVILIAVGTLGVAVGGILVGVSQNYIMFLVCLVIMGLMTGGYHPAATPLIISSVEPNKRGQVLGIHLVAGNSSFFVAPLAAGLIITLLPGLSWRGPYLILAVPTAIFGLIFYIYLTQKSGKIHAEAARRKMASENPPQPGYKRRLIAYLSMVVIIGGVANSLNSFLTLYMVDILGTSNARAATLYSILSIPGVFGGPLVGGWLADRIGSVKIVVVTSLISGLILFALRAVTLGFGFYAVLFAIGLNNAVRGPVTEVYIMSQTNSRNRSTMYGIYYFTMHYTGAIFAPIMAIFIERNGFSSMYLYAAIITTVVAFITSFFIWDAKDHYTDPTLPSPAPSK